MFVCLFALLCVLGEHCVLRRGEAQIFYFVVILTFRDNIVVVLFV